MNMNPPEQLTRKEPLIGIAALLSILFLTGCAAVNVTSTRKPDGEIRTTTRIYMPSWPWSDTRQMVNRLTVGAKTNSSTISFKGEQVQEINTNALNTVNHLLNTTDAILQKVP